ncbi:response regulator transcription factor [Intestinimonas sp. MSJ-38]|uniref:response regulator transcription factor n=1 Tax=Intestinimonas sp. MSJ-38 TaxID=2841532 RepID=UPI000E4EFA72|nr:response regulator transcription factor [Intestinimonas sp. MSJ-38]MBU5433715.1 response regulator transcription factor [Intestinimonas sp. MSJ-38]RHT71121.1 DNA-binding response regulator [Ruminococcaceae bacterium AM28-23LB]
MSGSPLIYCVEDDDSIRELICYALKSGGYQAEGFAESGDFWRRMEENTPRLVLLDIMLPGEDGMQLLHKMKNDAAQRNVPVIMLTAKTTELDKVAGLDAGADDYITKPFSVLELLSRVRAVLRRSQPTGAETLSCGEVTMDPLRRTVTSCGHPVELTYKEFELLCYMMRNCDIVLSRTRLMENVWGFDFEGESRTVDMHIKTLRQKLGAGGSIIKTVRGVGYKVSQRE